MRTASWSRVASFAPSAKTAACFESLERLAAREPREGRRDVPTALLVEAVRYRNVEARARVRRLRLRRESRGARLRPLYGHQVPPPRRDEDVLHRPDHRGDGEVRGRLREL